VLYNKSRRIFDTHEVDEVINIPMHVINGISYIRLHADMTSANDNPFLRAKEMVGFYNNGII